MKPAGLFSRVPTAAPPAAPTSAENKNKFKECFHSAVLFLLNGVMLFAWYSVFLVLKFQEMPFSVNPNLCSL